MSERQETVSVKEAAELLNTSVRQVRDWVRFGRVQSVKGTGNRRLILRSAIGTAEAQPRTAQRNVPSLHDRYVHGFEVPDRFDVITTYSELLEYTKAFSEGNIPFLLLVGSPGSGKTMQLKECLGSRRHKWIDNHASMLGLYCAVYQAAHSQVVLDDINHFFGNPMACSLIKALTQTMALRSVSWESTTQVLDRLHVPRQYTTSSPLCIIANQWDRTNVDMAAVQDRSLPVAFCPSAETIHERVHDLNWCDREVWEFIGKHLHKIAQPSMREYANGMTYRKSRMKWQEKLLKVWETQ
jgi:excisionase family DNA binding protein